MKLPIRMRLGVVTDLSQAADWYNHQRAGLGNEFIAEAYAAFDAIAERPQSFPVVRKDVRRALMKRFPYAIYFRAEREAVTIFVVIHTARTPREWKRRIR